MEFLATFENINTLWTYIQKGGNIMWVLALMSITWLGVFIYKWFEFRHFQISHFGGLNEILKNWISNPSLQTVKQLKGLRNPTARVLEIAIQGICGSCEKENQIREEVQRIACLELEKLRKHLPVVETIAAISPLMGLFGTVLGMIEAFHQVSMSTDQINPSQLSGGIWVALLTTAAGLAVGIPATISHTWLENKLARLTQQMDNAVTQIFTRNFMCECMRETYKN